MSDKIDMKRLHHGCGEALIAGQLRNTCATETVGRAQQDLRSSYSKRRCAFVRTVDKGLRR